MDRRIKNLALGKEVRSYPRSRVLNLILVLALALPGIRSITGCQQKVERTGAYAPDTTNDCLPNITLTDQNGEKVSLASLKGKPVLFDFIYTTCPGPCLMLTSRMRLMAIRLGPALGDKIRFVSVTVDPEHDSPAQLLEYSKQQGADQNGWLFLTGTPAQIDQVMAQFKLIRQREDNGTVDHVLEFFLVGADGRQLHQYAATRANPTTIASDIDQAMRTGALHKAEKPT